MIDLESVRTQARTITTEIDRGRQGFLTVSDYASAADAIEFGNANPPALYVSLSVERPGPNRLATGGIAQRVDSIVSLLFCLGAESASDERSDPIERARGSIIAAMVGFKPGGAGRVFHYAGWQLRGETGGGLVWGEVLVSTYWDLRL